MPGTLRQGGRVIGATNEGVASVDERTKTLAAMMRDGGDSKRTKERSSFIEAKKEINYLVLQGGGIRCAWQAGFITALDRAIPIRPWAISAVSASSTVACALVCRRLESAIDSFKAAIACKAKTTFVARMLKGQGILPHADIYRNAVLRTFDQAAMEDLFVGPDIQILVTRMSARLPKYPGMLAGLSLSGLQSFRAGRRMQAQFGFRKEFVPVKSCATPADLADLVLASSCTPPFTPFYSLHGRPVLDGGLTESVPLSGLPQRKGLTLALLTGKLATTDQVPGILYAGPSEDMHVNSWTYDTEKIDYLYALGQKDGRSFLNGSRNEV